MAKAAAKTDPFENDPFDTAPDQNDTGGDEAQAEITSQGVIAPKENPLVVKADEGKVTVTLKGGTGYNAPWVVIHGSTVMDALGQLSDTDLPALLEKAQKASKYFGDRAETPTPPPAQQGASQPQSGQPAAATAGTGGAVKFCKHGQMTPKSGVSQKTGKAWSGFFCPTPQNTPDQCDPQFNR